MDQVSLFSGHLYLFSTVGYFFFCVTRLKPLPLRLPHFWSSTARRRSSWTDEGGTPCFDLEGNTSSHPESWTIGEINWLFIQITVSYSIIKVSINPALFYMLKKILCQKITHILQKTNQGFPISPKDPCEAYNKKPNQQLQKKVIPRSTGRG